MLEELFDRYIPVLINIFEFMGIIILIIGSVSAFYHYFINLFFKKNINVKYEFADIMITTLDFKLAAEILKTVIIKSENELIITGTIFIIRIIMTFVLEHELKSEQADKKNSL